MRGCGRGRRVGLWGWRMLWGEGLSPRTCSDHTVYSLEFRAISDIAAKSAICNDSESTGSLPSMLQMPDVAPKTLA